MFVRMAQANVGALRKVGYRAPQSNSPIGIQSGISDYVGPGNTGILLHRIILLFPGDTLHVRVVSLFSFFFILFIFYYLLFIFYFFLGGGVHALPHRSDRYTDFNRSWVKRCVLV